jgi:hypothetical protein
MDKKPTNITEYSMKLKEESNIAKVTDIVEDNKDIGEEKLGLSQQDFKKLHRSKYFNVKDKYTTAFVLKNKKNGSIVEIQALSSIHACSFIGWRPKNVTLIDVIDVK